MIDDLLRDVLACPADRGAVSIDEEAGVVACLTCGRRYPIRDGIPVMLLAEATEPA